MSTYGYVRVSTVVQGNGTSLDEQERKIRGIALFNGVEVDAIFRDVGVSGSTMLEERPAGADLAAVLQDGDTLICAKLDRAFRDAADALTRAKSWKERGIKLILADLGTDSVTENGISKLFFTIVAGFAEWERERILERVSDGRKAKKAKGGFIGGTVPFGFRVIGTGKDAVLVADPATYPALVTIRTCRENGDSFREISAKIKAIHGADVSYQAVRRILADRDNARTPESEGVQ